MSASLGDTRRHDLPLPRCYPHTTMRSSLTVKQIEALKGAPSRREVPDGHVAGLYLVVQPGGAKSWALRYRSGGMPRKLTIGAWPAVTLGKARELGQRALIAIAEGKDPAAAKQTDRREAKAAAELAARQAAVGSSTAVEKVVERFVERHLKPNSRASSAKEIQRLLERNVVDVWRGRDLKEISRHDVIELLDGIIDRGAAVSANRTLAAFRTMCNWAVGRGLLDASPCAGVPSPTEERSRDRVLADEELRACWIAAGEAGHPFGALVRMLALTGQRRDEVGAMTWSEIDRERKVWVVPRERAKNDQQHEVPLSAAALAILDGLPRIDGAPGYVFTTGIRRSPAADGAQAPFSGFSKSKTRFDRAMIARLRADAIESGASVQDAEKIDIAEWRLHDLRRTVASGMARLGVQLPVIEKVLNHQSGSFAGIVGVYQRHSFSDEKRVALETWGRFVEQLAAGRPASNVVALRA